MNVRGENHLNYMITNTTITRYTPKRGFDYVFGENPKMIFREIAKW